MTGPIREEQTLMRVFLGERDRCPASPHRGKPLHEALLLILKEEGFQGATVVRGVAGFGANSVLHTGSLLRLSVDLPLILEVVDREEKIQAFLPKLESLMQGGMVTLERARVIYYGAEGRGGPDAQEERDPETGTPS